MTTQADNSRRRRGERGQVAGVETIPFGIAVFVGLTLVIVNGWGHINARSIADSIAREYLRAYTQSPSRTEGITAGERAALLVLNGHHVSPERVRIEPPTSFGPCVVAEVSVRIDLPALRVPFVGTLGASHVDAHQRDRVDGYRIHSKVDDAVANCDE